MTGPEAVRGPGYCYLDAVADIAHTDGRGAAVRVPFNEFNENSKFQKGIDDTLQALKLEPSAVDLFMDIETIRFLPRQYRNTEGLVSLGALKNQVQHLWEKMLHGKTLWSVGY